MMSMVTRCDQRRLRVTRASRAKQAARSSSMWSSKSSAQIPARHSTQARSPTLVGRVHSTNGSLPARVCRRASKHSFWMRCRASTHQHRRVTNRRECGMASSPSTAEPRMIPAHVSAITCARAAVAAVPVVRVASSVRHRQAMPAALRWSLTARSVDDVRVVPVVPVIAVDVAHHDHRPVRGMTPQAGQRREAPPWFFSARSRVRVPVQVRASVHPIPWALITASSRAPWP